jgi:hypothetical protein
MGIPAVKEFHCQNPECGKKFSGRYQPGRRFCPECHSKTDFRALGNKLKAQPPIQSGSTPPPEVSEQSADKWNISLPQTRIHTLQQLIDYFEIDTAIWEVERFVANKWEVASSNGEAVTVTPLYQVKATLKKKVAVEDALQEIERLKELAKKSAPMPKTVIRPRGEGYMLEVNIPDAHFGKLAWAPETGGPNYDTKIADETFRKAAEALFARTASYKFDEVVLVIGNDLLNSDDEQGRTTKGTSVSTDTRYQKTFVVVRNASIWLVERARQIAKKVIVVLIPGNHDKLSVWHLGDSLECYFHRYKDVEINNEPKSRKYVQFGKVMLMFTHGDKGKKDEYPLLMATEKPEMFGATKYREAHTGHLHKTKLDEKMGVRVRILPALCAPDEWHAEQGFVGNLRNAEAYIWSKEEGLVGTAIYNARDEE